MKEGQTISETLLLEGSWYALEQAGRLLVAATRVHNSGDPGTGLALALFGREEVGRSRILRAMAKETAGGATLNAADVAKRCEDHPTKQAAGASGTSLRIAPQSVLSRAIESRVGGVRGSEEWQAARADIAAASARKAKRNPHDWHAWRERALYVDLSPNAAEWSRPITIDATKAREEIEDALGDYAAEYDGLRDEVIGSDFPQMLAARATMAHKPLLAPPEWPEVAPTG
jgi:AbiV family abortive infection protein